MCTEVFSKHLESTYSPELKRTTLTDIVLKFLSFCCGCYSNLYLMPKRWLMNLFLSLSEVQNNIDKLNRIGLLVNNYPIQEVLAICFMNLRLPLRRCLYQLLNRNEEEK